MENAELGAFAASSVVVPRESMQRFYGRDLEEAVTKRGRGEVGDSLRFSPKTNTALWLEKNLHLVAMIAQPKFCESSIAGCCGIEFVPDPSRYAFANCDAQGFRSPANQRVPRFTGKEPERLGRR